MRTTAGPPPLVVRGRHLTDSVTFSTTRNRIKMVAVENPGQPPPADCVGCVRSTPACSLLGSDTASEHSSLTKRRGYALASLLHSRGLETDGWLAVFIRYALIWYADARDIGD